MSHSSHIHITASIILSKAHTLMMYEAVFSVFRSSLYCLQQSASSHHCWVVASSLSPPQTKENDMDAT